jgi:hypothetical protein
VRRPAPVAHGVGGASLAHGASGPCRCPDNSLNHAYRKF